MRAWLCAFGWHKWVKRPVYRNCYVKEITHDECERCHMWRNWR